jgi:hypothetical protein
MLTWKIRENPRTYYGAVRPHWHPHYRIRGKNVYNGAKPGYREFRYVLTFTSDGLHHQEMATHKRLFEAKHEAEVDAQVRQSTGGFPNVVTEDSLVPENEALMLDSK